MVAGTELLNAVFDIFRADQRDTDQNIWCQYYFGTDAAADGGANRNMSEKTRHLQEILKGSATQRRSC
ncbi:hypothetical protein [Sphingomonas lacusdianchii]|uniref:hypothetical protein n=1 Tax=Sphingomonas lacusdianchii TaxID=2917992 RepID=UPI001F58ED4C|nr:hypothetical protein [Sphingomonas sp. JXJ CY 53]